MTTFREIELSGGAHERGLAHGEQMRDEIGAAIEFYRAAFGLHDARVHEQAAYFRRVIANFNPDYATEMEGIAEAAGQDTLWVVALNARTEILALKTLNATDASASNECTSLCFGDTAVLGQTWDWGETLESLCAVARLTRPDGHAIRMLIEPGMLGKIGMNNAGLGVCLNILTLMGRRLDGVPVHVMLRAILDCGTASAAASVIDGAATGKASNVMVADKAGNCFDREFAGPETLMPDAVDGNHIHTNHYCGRAINVESDPLFLNSQTRMTRVKSRVAEAPDHSVSTMKDILSDRADDPFPVFRPYMHMRDDGLGAVGTVATMVMDLQAGEFHIRKGTGTDSPFVCYSV